MAHISEIDLVLTDVVMSGGMMGAFIADVAELVEYRCTHPGSSSRAGCRPQPPVLSVRCGASRRPAGGIQRWSAAYGSLLRR